MSAEELVEVSTVLEAAPREGLARGKHVPGEEGVWVFLFGDMCLFATFFAVYLHERGGDPRLFAASQEQLNRDFGALNTLLLLVSSLFVVLAVRAMRMPRHRHRASLLVLCAMGGGIGFVVVKVFEYHEKLASGITPATNGFFMYYFVLTGLHLMHLVVGLGVLTVLWRLTRKPELSQGQWRFFEGGACFWHMVDLLWIVLFPLLFLVR